jgi:hypothetical protein
MNPYEATQRAAENGIARSSQGARAWHPFIALVIHDTAVRLPYLTSDDVRDEISIYFPRKVPFNLMALGAFMQKAQRDGTLLKTGRTRKSRTRSQHRDREVFASAIFYPGARLTRGGIQPPLLTPDVEP